MKPDFASLFINSVATPTTPVTPRKQLIKKSPFKSPTHTIQLYSPIRLHSTPITIVSSSSNTSNTSDALSMALYRPTIRGLQMRKPLSIAPTTVPEKYKKYQRKPLAKKPVQLKKKSTKHSTPLSNVNEVVPSQYQPLFPLTQFNSFQSKFVALLLQTPKNVILYGSKDLILFQLAITNSLSKKLNKKIILLTDNEVEAQKLTYHWTSLFSSINTAVSNNSFDAQIIICSSLQFYVFLLKDTSILNTISLVLVDQLESINSNVLNALEPCLMYLIPTKIRLIISTQSYSNNKQLEQWLNINTVLTTKSSALLKSSFNLHLSTFIILGLYHSQFGTIESMNEWIQTSFYAKVHADSKSLVSEHLTRLNELGYLADLKVTPLGELMATHKLPLSSMELLQSIDDSCTLFQVCQMCCKLILNVVFIKGDKIKLYAIKSTLYEWFKGHKPKSPVKETYEKVMILLIGLWSKKLDNIPFINEANTINTKFNSLLSLFLQLAILNQYPNAFYQGFQLWRFSALKTMRETSTSSQTIEVSNSNEHIKLKIKGPLESTMATLICFDSNLIVYKADLDMNMQDMIKFDYYKSHLTVMLLFHSYIGRDVLMVYKMTSVTSMTMMTPQADIISATNTLRMSQVYLNDFEHWMAGYCALK